ncbi:hypothetical protein C8Q76DRAFT_754750 [Earliella scabrosa]|nr:hypothetical protein C8Q76DRAFT_754750 [Earliella scabrosa]
MESRSPSPRASRRQSFAGPPPPSSAVASTSSRRHSLPPSEDDVIVIPSDSEQEDAGGSSSGYDENDFWNFAPFNGQPSRYALRKAAEAQRKENDQDDPMELDDWAGESTSFGGNRGPNGMVASSASASKKGVSGRRSYRDFDMPSSSQESTLDGGSQDFFKNASAFIDLS